MTICWSVIDAGPTRKTLVAHNSGVLMYSAPLDMTKHGASAKALEVEGMRASERLGVTFTSGSWASDYARNYWAGIKATMADRVARRAA